jgi:hypothetical protein
LGQVTKTYRIFGDSRPRYTNRSICANPCDGHDDLCKDYADEECLGISFHWVLTIVGMTTLSASGLMLLVELTSNHRRNMHFEQHDIVEKSISISDLRKTESLDGYRKLRNNVDYAVKLQNRLLYFEHTGNVHKAKQLSNHYYNMEYQHKNSNTKLADKYFFDNLGTNQSTMFFFELLDNGFYIRMIKGSPKFNATILSHTSVQMGVLSFKFLSRVLLHYADLVKDIMLVSQIWKYYLGSNIMTLQQVKFEFPSVVLCIIIMSILSSEVLSAITWWNSEIYHRHAINQGRNSLNS